MYAADQWYQGDDSTGIMILSIPNVPYNWWVENE